MGLEEKYAFLEKEKQAQQLQLEELRVSVEMEKQERTNVTHQRDLINLYGKPYPSPRGREVREQQVEAELLVDEIGMSRMGIYQVFKALENDSEFVSKDKVENEQTFLHYILGSVEDLKCSLRMYEFDKQQLLIENSALLTLVAQLKSEGLELQSMKKSVEEELNIVAEKLITVDKDNQGLIEMTKKLQ
ncbi:hypothetical protein RND71_015705 [Anisodus tanguticus]|uniref:Uncharacterized protein n=1 Tax=Anisodus tanguticus TaxID=243964 RepID=A0AAE1S713_9SOLA|nr:hypothetical protein RND71_015705 [Anisodus tanguticus]